MTRRSGAWLAVQAIVTVTLLVLLARSLDVAAMRALFAGIPLSFYLTSLAAVLAGQVAYAWRWRLLLTAAGVSVPFTNVLRQYFVGIFVNNFLPSTVGGDVAKVYYLGQAHGFRIVGASIAVDRILGVGLMAVLATGALWLSPISASRLTAALVGCAGITMVAATLLILTGHGTGGLAARVTPLGERAVRLAGLLQRVRLDMAAPLRRPKVVVQAAVIVIGYALAMTAVYLRFVSLQNAPVASFLAMFAVVTATIVLSNVPIALNGLGLREQLHASLLAPLAIPPEMAVAISLLLYAHVLVGSLIGLAFWLQTR